MAWGAILQQVTKSEGNIIASVRFTESVTNETFVRDVRGNDLTPDRLAQFCQTVIENLEMRDISAVGFVVGPIVLPRDSKDPATIAKVAAIAAADAFFVLQSNVQVLQKQVDAGIIKVDDPALLAAQEAVKVAFLPEYANDPRFGQ